MGKRLDDLEKGAATVAVGLSLLDRLAAWWKRRQEAKAEARRVATWEAEQRTSIELQRISDGAAFRNGAPTCTALGCLRPRFHTGEHGRRL